MANPKTNQDEGWRHLEDPACQSKPGVSVKATMHQEMPPEVVEVMQKHDLKIRLDKVNASNFFDQIPGMVAKDGCISAPSGPGC